ncbi:choice-of-anchor Q domain-containing protein [Bythopirellula goksoeyrii]|nr:choice-of-anchor Q domain-containing protein [Bythopirellula goksoeyrii]
MSAFKSFKPRSWIGQSHSTGRGLTRSLRIEPLESRRLLATFAVANLNDAGLGSLRQAIDDANQNPGFDSIDLSAVSGTISLTSGEFLITDFVSIEGPGADTLTIDAQENSRIFHLQTPTGNNSVAGLRLVNGLTTGADQPGGAIYSETFGVLTLNRMEIFSSGTEGDDSPGGAVYSKRSATVTNSVIGNSFTRGADSPGGGISAWFDEVQINDSTISTNKTEGPRSGGGGVYSRLSTRLEDALVSGNTTHGHNSRGGGVFAPNTSVALSEIRDNHTYGESSEGGGIYSTMSSLIVESLLQGNSTTGEFSTGGGLFFDRSLSLVDSQVLANKTHGDHSAGGGIFGSDLANITGTTIAQNVTEGELSQGGGIRFFGNFSMTDSQVIENGTYGLKAGGAGMRVDNQATIVDSNISGNVIYGSEGWGGGLFVTGVADIATSTISHNESRGFQSVGGGIFSEAQTTITRSLVYANAIYGDDGFGGGIFHNLPLTLDNSTVSGNLAGGSSEAGGGIFSNANLTLRQSTITNNRASFLVGGVWNQEHATILEGSIVADNTAHSVEKDMFQFNGSIQANYSLIGNSTGSTLGGNSGIGNLLNVSPLLGPLADNGGPTKTHALLPGSPAIDAGDPSVQFDPDSFDQRGLARVADGDPPESLVIDIGAYEAQIAPSADFDSDGDVDGHDFLAWQRGFGKSNAVPADGDSDDDGDVDASDLATWQLTYDEVVSPMKDVQRDVFSVESPAWALNAAIALTYGDDKEGLKATPILELSFVATQSEKVTAPPMLPVPTGEGYDRRTLARSPFRPAARNVAHELAAQCSEPFFDYLLFNAQV